MIIMKATGNRVSDTFAMNAHRPTRFHISLREHVLN